MWQTFKDFDADGNGWVSKKEMKDVIKHLGVVRAPCACNTGLMHSV